MSVATSSSKIPFKIIALLSIVRWYNILIVAITLYLSSLFVLDNISDGIITTLKDYKLHFSVIALCLLMMAGFIINAFYDFEKDIINRPEETIFGRVVSKSFCLNSYVVLILIGLILSAMVNIYVFGFNFLFSFGLWFYSHKLRKLAFTAEINAALLTIAPFISLSLYYKEVNLMIVLYVGYIFMLSFTREVIKKMTSLKGDLIVREKSIPILLGIRKTKIIILILILITVYCIMSLLLEIRDLKIFYYYIFALSCMIAAIALLYLSKKPRDFERLNLLYKILIFTAILAIPLVRY